jgi:hypothetical protein
VDNATGTQEDRFRAIIRLLDYHHHHQTLTFLILDHERYARKLKHAAKEAKSIHHTKRYVTRPEYLRIWPNSFEFSNFSPTELAAGMSKVASLSDAAFSAKEVAACKSDPKPGAALNKLYLLKTGQEIPKLALTDVLVEGMMAPGCRRAIENRPIIQTLNRVAQLAAKNPFPTMLKTWERNQTSKHLGKKR